MNFPLFFEVFPDINYPEDFYILLENVKIESIKLKKTEARLNITLRDAHFTENDALALTSLLQNKLYPDNSVMVEICPSKEDIKKTLDTAPISEPKVSENDSKTKKTVLSKQKEKTEPKDSTVIFGKPLKEDSKITKIIDIEQQSGDVTVQGKVFGDIEARPLRNEKYLLSIPITDYTDSIMIKLFVDTKEESDNITESLKKKNIKVKGIASPDTYEFNEYTLKQIKSIQLIDDFRILREDKMPTKRIELHAHTKSTELDATADVGELISTAVRWGHEAIAITDTSGVYVFPEAAKKAKNDIKIIYGLEGFVCDDLKPIVNAPADYDYPIDGDFIVFDLETTGLNTKKVKIIEIGAVHVKNGVVVDTFSTFVNPEMPIPYRIVELTGVTDAMVSTSGTIREIMPKFLQFCNGLPMVAHNAEYDISVMTHTCQRLGLEFNPPYTDTIAIAKILLPELHRFGLENVVKALKMKPFDHHRAVEDARVTADIFNKFVSMLKEMNISSISQLNNPDLKDNTYIEKLFRNGISILCKNDLGRLNLYRLVSKSHIDHFYQSPRIPKTLLAKHRDGLLIGSGPSKERNGGEIFEALLTGRPMWEIENMVSFYDFLEIMPADACLSLINTPDDPKYGILSTGDIEDINKQIILLGEKFNKPVVAIGNVHFINPEDNIYTEIILTEKKERHRAHEPNLYFRTTEEMLNAFAYLGEEKAWEVVIDNPHKINRMIEKIKPTRPDKCVPVIENSDNDLRDICYKKAHSMYGDPLPELVKTRLDKELNSIINNGYAVMYMIAQKLVAKSYEAGYIVGSRGSVGSSFVATMADISEVNPLPPHYLCPNCKYSDFDSEFVKPYSEDSGYDMPDRDCPVCGNKLGKSGFNIPFETFLGFEGDKEPDIDLNIAGVYQTTSHKEVENIFGKGQAFHAGTVSTVADATSVSMAKKFFENKDIKKRRCEIQRIAAGIMDAKTTTGQHAGGIIVLPIGEEIESFTPLQYPANKASTNVITTHFDYHAIDSNLLKLDMLGKDDPTMLRYLKDMTGLDANDIPLDDKKVISLFSNTSALNVTPEDLMGIDFGTLSLPEYGTATAMNILRETKPKNFMDLVRIAGFSHGTDVYFNNAKDLIEQGTATITTAISTRDGIMLYLIDMGIEPGKSFKITESVRKGKGLTPEMKETMIAANVPDWYIWSCETIKYMFPKAHAAAYAMMAYRLGYYKVYYPLAFYSTIFTVKNDRFNYKMMCQGIPTIEHHMKELEESLNSKDIESRDKEKNKKLLQYMRTVYEMYKRGYEFLPIDLYKSDAVAFKEEDGKIRPPFLALDKLGEASAIALYEAAKKPFSSKEDVKKRGKISSTMIDQMSELGILDGLPATDQLSLFDFM